MRAALSILLVLHLLHLPVPCPDLDGECRGVPIEGLADANAWHIVLLGVRPNDDVDRGPIRPVDSDHDSSPSPFCNHAAVAASKSHVGASAITGEPDLMEACFSPELDPSRLSGSSLRLSWLQIRGEGPPLLQRDSVLRI
jgi:hypothetical protein